MNEQQHDAVLWLGAIADTDDRPNVRKLARKTLGEFERLLRVEKAALEWVAGRQVDARYERRSLISSAQKLLDALNGEESA